MNSTAMSGDGEADAAFRSDVARCLDTSGGFTAYQGGELVLAPCYPIHPNALRSGEAKTLSPDAEGRMRLRDPGFGVGGDGDPADTITAAGPGYVAAPADVLPFDTTQIRSPLNYSVPKAGDPCHPLAAGAHPPAVCVTGSVTHTLKAEGFDASEDGTGRGQPIVAATAFDILGTPASEVAKQTDVHAPLRARAPGQFENSTVTMVATTMAVRRLMPIECERLQGFPDGHTAVPVKKVARDKMKPDVAYVEIGGEMWQIAADGPRYKQLGNSMAVDVVRWIGERIARQIAAARPMQDDGLLLDDLAVTWLLAA